MQNTEVKPEADLKQFHKATDRHVLVLEADISERDKRKLLHMSNIIRVAGNELIAVMKKQYEQLLRNTHLRGAMKNGCDTFVSGFICHKVRGCACEADVSRRKIIRVDNSYLTSLRDNLKLYYKSHITAKMFKYELLK